MFENLQERLERSFKILKGEGRITEINVAETLKDIRRALLDADVSYKVAKEFCDRVKSQLAIGETAITLKRFMVYLRDEKRAEFVCFLEPGPRFSLMFTPIGYSLSLSND